jgi:nucleotide-binding universal stress UspA family protein
MKNIVIATDFSANARYAVEYGFKLAGQLKENVVLCNAFMVPAEIPDAGVLVWPQYDYEDLFKDSSDELKELEDVLQNSTGRAGFHPLVARVSEDGPLPEIINKVVAEQNAHLVVMGTHGHSGPGSFVLGNHSRKMIDEATCPLLLVPPSVIAGLIKKVAFATDFNEPEKDLRAIFQLIPLLKKLNAELLLTHIYNEIDYAYDFKKNIEGFLLELSNKADYPNIYYRIVKSEKPEKGLDWLCQFGNVDMLAMVHRKHSFLNKIITGSHTQKMAGHISIPLLVIPSE